MIRNKVTLSIQYKSFAFLDFKYLYRDAIKEIYTKKVVLEGLSPSESPRPNL